MGLDQYAYAKLPKENLTEEQKKELLTTVLTEGKFENEPEELYYWRKHNALQGWMENLYRKKGGQDEFNCVDLPLTLEDLDELELVIHQNRLVPTEGFFFGGNYDPTMYAKDDLEFIKKAREAIAENKVVVYSCWW